MRLLLTICLCFTSTTLAFGDEKSKPVDLGIDAPSLEEGAKAEASEWRPRLVILLKTNDKFPQGKVVVTQETFASPVPYTRLSPPDYLPKSGESAVYLKAFEVSPGQYFSLYSDAATLNILQSGNTPTYHLECKSRIHICTEGFSVDADSASLKDGKCELANAKFTCGVVSATATQLTLTLPIYSVSTRNFGQPIPKIPHGLITYPSTEASFDDGDARKETFPREIIDPFTPEAVPTEKFSKEDGVPAPTN